MIISYGETDMKSRERTARFCCQGMKEEEVLFFLRTGRFCPDNMSAMLLKSNGEAE